MVKECTLQVFIDGIWRDAAGLALVGDEASGIGAPTFLSYGADYTLAHLQRQDAAALSVNHKIDLVVASSATWPPFLIDLLPQGHGRKELLHQLGRDENAGPAADWAQRAEDFNEYLAQHGLFLAGSSGIQGEWPKVLLTRARDGLFYLDHALPDEQAEQHYIVKFGRGTDHALANILRCEGAYMQLAR